MQITVNDRQSLPDIALLALGSLAGLFALAVRNGISVTSQLSDGQVLNYELEDVVSLSVRSAYALQSIAPATDIDRADYLELLYQTGTPRPLRKVQKPDPETAIPDKLEEVLEALEKGETIIPKAPQQFTRVFQDPFSEVFS